MRGEFITTTKQIKKGRKSCGCLSKNNRFKIIDDIDYFKTVKLNHYKTSAKRRNLIFNLTDIEFLVLITGNCNYCGSPPNLINKTKLHSIFLNGIDRVNNQLGYLSNNVVSCCKTCNSAKSNLSLVDFENWIDRLIKYKLNIN